MKFEKIMKNLFKSLVIILSIALIPGLQVKAEEQIKIVDELSKNNGGSDFKWADTLEKRNKMWRARWDAWYSAVSYTHLTLPTKRIV